MSDRDFSRERDSRRDRRRSPASPRNSRSPSPRRHSRSTSRHRSRRSPSPGDSHRPQNDAHRENPIPSAVLGVFGLSQYTTERDLKDVFQKFGRIKDTQIVIDKKTNKSRGFGFIYFEEVENATRAKEALNSTELNHHRLRIDYSVTKRAHTPTPGIYMGVRTSSSYHRSNGHSYRRSPSYDRKYSHRKHRHHDYRSRSRTRSRSRSRSRSKSRRGGDRRRRSPGYVYD